MAHTAYAANPEEHSCPPWALARPGKPKENREMGLLSFLAKRDGYDLALEHYRQVEGLRDQPDAYLRELREAVKHCQDCIRRLPTNADAYVLLADAYQLMATEAEKAGDLDAQDELMSLASAVIHEWTKIPNGTHNGSRGRELLAEVAEYHMSLGLSAARAQSRIVAANISLLNQALGRG
jgi:hypothetical protein